MPIGGLKTEGDLERFMRDRMPNVGPLIRQLQGGTRAGTGSPEGVVEAPVGTLYRRRDGGPGSTLYVKESGIGPSGWAAK